MNTSKYIKECRYLVRWWIKEIPISIFLSAAFTTMAWTGVSVGASIAFIVVALIVAIALAVRSFVWIIRNIRYANEIRSNKDLDIEIDKCISKQKSFLAIILIANLLKLFIWWPIAVFAFVGVVGEIVLKVLFWKEMGDIESKKGQQMFEVNDLVFIQHLGFKGIVQEIDYGKNYAVIGVQMFGRRQPVECKISKISPI